MLARERYFFLASVSCGIARSGRHKRMASVCHSNHSTSPTPRPNARCCLGQLREVKLALAECFRRGYLLVKSKRSVRHSRNSEELCFNITSKLAKFCANCCAYLHNSSLKLLKFPSLTNPLLNSERARVMKRGGDESCNSITSALCKRISTAAMHCLRSA